MEPELGSSDEDLASRARDGDEAAFRALYERHADALRRQIRRSLPGIVRRKVAESDVIQAAFLGVHQGLRRFSDRGEGSFEAWLRQIVDHKVQDLLRRYVQCSRRAVGHEVSGVAQVQDDGVASRDPTPSAVAQGRELRDRVVRAMELLPAPYRLVLRLVREEGLTLRAAGERMGRTEAAAEKLYGRALARLALLVQDGG